MICNCPSEDYIQSIVEGVVVCTRTIVLEGKECPQGCTLVLDQLTGNAYCDCVEEVDPIIKNVLLPVAIDETTFRDVSWTIAFSPIMNSWIGYYSFKPNYYISHNNYFQTGINNPTDETEFGLWSHLLTNKSYGVFYGKKYGFEIEYPIKDDLVGKTLQNVNLFTEVRRYHNNYDFAPDVNLSFNKSIIYNNTHCSGYLNLIPEKNRSYAFNDYPKTNNDGTQDIMLINSDVDKWSYNYFYNRVKSNFNNLPFIEKDENQIQMFLNPNAVSFKGKSFLERIEGNYFLNRLTYDMDSRLSIIFKLSTSSSEI